MLSIFNFSFLFILLIHPAVILILNLTFSSVLSLFSKSYHFPIVLLIILNIFEFLFLHLLLFSRMILHSLFLRIDNACFLIFVQINNFFVLHRIIYVDKLFFAFLNKDICFQIPVTGQLYSVNAQSNLLKTFLMPCNRIQLGASHIKLGE